MLLEIFLNHFLLLNVVVVVVAFVVVVTLLRRLSVVVLALNVPDSNADLHVRCFVLFFVTKQQVCFEIFPEGTSKVYRWACEYV
jgi:hypothetical protein